MSGSHADALKQVAKISRVLEDASGSEGDLDAPASYLGLYK